jgi:hypothetical protein
MSKAFGTQQLLNWRSIKRDGFRVLSRRIAGVGIEQLCSADILKTNGI